MAKNITSLVNEIIFCMALATKNRINYFKEAYFKNNPEYQWIQQLIISSTTGM
jgi:hypothetical protein